ncbi:Origin recognition complex subunit 2 [Microtus ochrogaster]|uniref:Origin recognition complex subunit 2 n=1 Tax=Microtus ochrogaster TaxID=79684 RepID=A0A8J6GS20_MICOH|nr:Origin recognition complex subunit 2 [Microtus ochrogaster]
MLGHAWRYWLTLGDAGRRWAILGDAGRFWGMLGDAGDAASTVPPPLAMMSSPQMKEAKVPVVQFVGDDDVLNHIFDREGGTKIKKEKAQLLVNPQKIIKKPECELEKRDQEVLKDQNYVEVLGRNIQALELAKTPRKVVAVDSKNDPEVKKNVPRQSKVPTSHCDTESEYSASSSEDDGEEETTAVGLSPKGRAQSRGPPAPAPRGTPPKKMKRDKASDLVEEYFEAHSSSKVLTSDRTLQKLRRAKVDPVSYHHIRLL